MVYTILLAIGICIVIPLGTFIYNELFKYLRKRK